MKHATMGLVALLSLFVCTGLGTAQTVVEIPAMTVANSAIDMDNVGPAGPTTVAAINAAGTNGGANIASIVLTASTAALGVYDTNSQLGRALTFDAATNGLALVDPYGTYDAFNAQINLGGPSTEFGVAIGDWVSTMVLDFYSGPTFVTSFNSSSYSTGAAKFYQLQGGPTFDTVHIRASSTVGNWVIAELHVELPGGWQNYGNGYPGTNGIPTLTLSASPQIGTQPNMLATSSATTMETSILFMGYTKAVVPGFWKGSLYLVPAAAVFLPMPAGGWTLPLPIPNNPALVGFMVYFQVLQSDPGATMGASSTPGLEMTIQP